MDPLTLIVAALATGAAAGLKPTAEQAIKDAYEGIKAFIKKKFGGKISVDDLEKNPASESKRGSLREDLESADAQNDQELLTKANELIQVVEKHDPESYGIYLKEISGRNLDIDSVHMDQGTGVKVDKGIFTEDVKIKNVTIKKSPDTENPK
ncbi:MAG: hypothetical protein IPO83_00455 [Chitinophagaceae bacterium]|nr:hypothetical protein [Chitinophagaceae bacterium]